MKRCMLFRLLLKQGLVLKSIFSKNICCIEHQTINQYFHSSHSNDYIRQLQLTFKIKRPNQQSHWVVHLFTISLWMWCMLIWGSFIVSYLFHSGGTRLVWRFSNFEKKEDSSVSFPCLTFIHTELINIFENLNS